MNLYKKYLTVNDKVLHHAASPLWKGYAAFLAFPKKPMPNERLLHTRTRLTNPNAYQFAHGMGEHTVNPAWWYVVSTASIDPDIHAELKKYPLIIRNEEYQRMRDAIIDYNFNLDYLWLMWFFIYGIESADYICDMYDVNITRGKARCFRLLEKNTF